MPIVLVGLLALAPLAGERGPVELRDWTFVGPSAAFVDQIVVDPLNAGVAYAIANGLLWQTADGGTLWSRIAEELESQAFHSVAVDPSSSETLFVTTGSGFYRSDDRGATWSPRGTGLPAGSAFAIGVSPPRPGRVYCLSEGRLFRSDNRGDDWMSFPPGPWPADAGVVWVSPDPVHADSVYVGVAGHRLYRSRDAGGHWAPLGLGLPSDVGPIAIDPTDSRIMYTSGFKSRDSGSTWLPLPVPATGQPVVIDPSATSTVYMAGPEGVYRSADAGLTWHLVGNGLPPAQVESLAIDAREPSILYAGTSFDGVFRSDDRGSTWSAANGGFPPVPIASLDVDRLGGTLYAGGDSVPGSRVFRRPVEGGAWTQTRSPALGGLYPWVYVTADPTEEGIVYAAGGTCMIHPPSCSGGASRTRDAGADWTRLVGGVTGPVAVDPADPRSLFAVFYDSIPNPDFPGVGQIAGTSMKSVDAGATWLELDVPPSHFAFDEARPGTVFAATEAEGVWVSADAGGTWVPVNAGLTDLETHALAVDPVDSTIHVATGAGVFVSTDGGGHWNATPLAVAVTSLLADPSAPGAVYAGSESGVYRIGEGGTLARIGSGVSGVTDLAIDEAGHRLWASTFAGVFEYDLRRLPPRVAVR